MLGSKTVRFHVAVATALGAALAAGIFACAGSTTPQTGSGAAPAVIEDVIVESGSESSTVTLVGPSDPVFTAFQQTGPDRVIVDVAGVEPGAVSEPLAVYDGTIEEVSVSTFSTGMGEAMTRVEIALSGPADYDVRPAENGLSIEISPLSEMDEVGSTEPTGEIDDGDPWAIVPAGGLEDTADGWEASDADSSLDEPAELGSQIEMGPATQLTGVDARALGEGSMIHLVANGTVESAVTFTLEDPDRLVVDLPALHSTLAQDRFEVGSAQVARVRVGAHEDKIRVVIDAADTEGAFEGRRVMPVATGLLIALGAGAELEDAGAAATAAAPSQMALAPIPDVSEEIPADLGQPMADEGAETVAEDAEGAVTIYGVEFDAQDGRDRVVVLGEEPVNYLVYEPDSGTVVISLEGAVIDPEAAVRIAPEPGGPVSLVTAFDQPDVRRPEVRVVVKRADNLKPEVSRRGALLLIDFPRTGGIAATPPILSQEGALSVADATLAAGGEALPVADDAASADAMLPVEGGMDMPAALPPAGAPMDVADVPADAAAIDPPASISILREGGLMDGKEYVGRRISLDFKDVEVADVLRLIAEVSDLNVIAGDEVKGAVTIRLVDVPWDQALDVILLTKGLGFVRIGNVLRVAATDVLAQEEELRLQERRAKEKLEDLVVKLQPVNYADVADVSGMVSQLLTPRGSVNTDTRTNTLIIKDIASVIDEATALVKAVDTMTPQVMIEAKVVEASLDFSREFGSVWSFGTNPVTQGTLGGRDWVFTDGVGLGDSDPLGNNLAFGNPITAGPSSLVNIAATVLDGKFNIEAQIQAAEVNGDGKVISSPRIVTLDNSEASIEQGVSIPFQTFENGDAQLEFVDAVLQLKVTPHITSDKSIIMEIEVSRNAPDDSVFTLTGSPAIAKNQVKTMTLVKDGQTLVLGGIYVVDKSERQSRVPYLHKIPFLGNAFRSDEFSDSRKELLVFVTPRVVRTPAAAS